MTGLNLGLRRTFTRGMRCHVSLSIRKVRLLLACLLACYPSHSHFTSSNCPLSRATSDDGKQCGLPSSNTCPLLVLDLEQTTRDRHYLRQRTRTELRHLRTCSKIYTKVHLSTYETIAQDGHGLQGINPYPPPSTYSLTLRLDPHRYL